MDDCDGLSGIGCVALIGAVRKVCAEGAGRTFCKGAVGTFASDVGDGGFEAIAGFAATLAAGGIEVFTREGSGSGAFDGFAGAGAGASDDKIAGGGASADIAGTGGSGSARGTDGTPGGANDCASIATGGLVSGAGACISTTPWLLNSAVDARGRVAAFPKLIRSAVT